MVEWPCCYDPLRFSRYSYLIPIGCLQGFQSPPLQLPMPCSRVCLLAASFVSSKFLCQCLSFTTLGCMGIHLTGLKGSGLPVMRQLPRHLWGQVLQGLSGKQWRVLLKLQGRGKVCIRNFACSRVCDSAGRLQQAAKPENVHASNTSAGHCMFVRKCFLKAVAYKPVTSKHIATLLASQPCTLSMPCITYFCMS